MGGEGVSVFSGGAGDGGCAGQSAGGSGGRSFSRGGGGCGVAGPARWVTRAVTVPVQLAACAVRPPICVGRNSNPCPGTLDRTGPPCSLHDPLIPSKRPLLPQNHYFFFSSSWDNPLAESFLLVALQKTNEFPIKSKFQKITKKS